MSDSIVADRAFAKAVKADRAKYGTALAGSFEGIDTGDVNDPKTVDFEHQNDDEGNDNDPGEGSEAALCILSLPVNNNA